MERDTGEWLPPDEEFDALNDETFGDDGDAEDFNWEAAQALLNDFEKLKPNGKSQRGSASKDSRVDFSHQGLSDSFDKDFDKVIDDDFDNENALEESISRLVMDDFDDDEEAEARKNKLRRLGATGSSMNTYFMPPQVVNKHLQWFMDKDLPGGSSLLGSSVWSMHPTSSPADVSASHQSNAVKTHHASDPRHQQASYNVLQKLTGQAPPNLNNAMGIRPSNSAAPKPVFKTVEEIERELMESSDEPNNLDNSPLKVVTNHRPRVITAEELERELMEDSTPLSKPARDQQIPSPMKPNMENNILYSPNNIQGPSNMSGSPLSQRTNVTTPGRAPPGMAVNMNHIMMQKMPPHPHMSPNQAAYAQAQRMMANAQMQQRAVLAFHQNAHMMNQMMMGGPQMRNRMPMMMPPMGHPGRPGFHMHPNQMPPPQFMRQFRSEDPYRGLMNEKDKQRLRNIQIIQLQNDHPYTTDYYSLMYRVCHGSDLNRQNDYLSKLYPKKCDENSNRNNYQPAHFENSLGKLQAVSALAPKKAIDTVIRVVDAGPTNRGGMKAYRYLLLEIEKLYECLLKMQEGDIRNSILRRRPLEYTSEERNKNEQRVKEVLEPQHKLSEILSVHKGKMLVSRLMPLMNETFTFYLFSHMINNFPDWGATKNSDIHKAYPFLRHCIFSASMSNIIFTFNRNVPVAAYESMLTSKLGISLLMALFHRAECIFLEGPEASPDEKTKQINQINHEQQLTSYLKETNLLVQTLLSNVHTLAMPIQFPASILKHFARWGYLPEQLQQLQSALLLWDKHSIPILQ